MAEIFANNAAGTLSADVTNTDTSFSVETGHTFPAPGAGEYFRATLWAVSNGEEVNHEIVKVTDVTNDVLTVERAQEGTTAQSWSSGTDIELRLTAGGLKRFFSRDPENATDSGTDAYVSEKTTAVPGDKEVIVRDFRSTSTTTTPTLDGVTIVARDGSALRIGVVFSVHALQYVSASNTYRLLNPVDLGLTVEDGGTVVLDGVPSINFGARLTVSDDGDGSVTVSADKVPSVVYQSAPPADTNVVWVKSGAVAASMYGWDTNGVLYRLDDAGNLTYSLATSDSASDMMDHAAGFLFGDDQGSNDVYKRDPADGSVVWTYGNPVNIPFFSMTADNAGISYAGDDGQVLYKIDTDGTQLVSNDTNISDIVDIWAEPDGDYIYALYLASCQVSKNRKSDLSQVWLVSLSGDNGINIVGDDKGHVYVTDTGSRLRKVDVSDGSQLTNSDTGSDSTALGISDDGDHLFIGNSVEETRKIKASDLSTVWNVDLGTFDTTESIKVDKNGFVYVANNTLFFKLNPADGSVAWQYDTGALTQGVATSAGLSSPTEVYIYGKVEGAWKLVKILDKSTGLTTPVMEKTGDYTVAELDIGSVVAVTDTTSARTVTLLPAATAGDGFTIGVYSGDGANTVTVDGDGAETIDGAATLTLAEAGDSVLLVCDGAKWRTLTDTRGLRADRDELITGTWMYTERSSDPANPPEGQWVMWMSDGTGSGADGDIMAKITAGGTTKTVTLVDFSAS